MLHTAHRREKSVFLTILMLLTAGTHWLPVIAANEWSVALEHHDRALKVVARHLQQTNHSRELATYNMPAGGRPFLHPVRDPSGQVVLTDDKPADHPWQHGIFTGYHRVNGLNYWKEDEGRQRFVKLLNTSEQPRQVSWTALIELVAPDGTVVLEEENKITFHALESTETYLVDYDILLRAKNKAVNFGKFFVGGLSIRMPWNQANPRQTHLNSEGLIGRAGEQKRARWCTVEQPFGDQVYGFAILDHPKNANHPSGWRVDEQGLINPNISMLEDWSIRAGEHLSFSYRIVVYKGKAQGDAIEQQWRGFSVLSR